MYDFGEPVYNVAAVVVVAVEIVAFFADAPLPPNPPSHLLAVVGMALTLEELQDIQAGAMADDVDIDFDRMQLWTAAQAAAYFESGGTEPPDEQVTASPSPPPRAPTVGTSKELDLVIVGATGLVGKWCCQLLSELAAGGRGGAPQLLAEGEAPPTWGVAGRASDKLDALAKKYGVRKFVLVEDEPQSFDTLTAATALVVAVAGPYRQAIPRQLIAACARAKHVAYFDLTGEYTLVADVVKQHDAAARANGSALITMCGPEEVCAIEMGVMLAAKALRGADSGAGARAVQILTAQHRAAMSGGSIASGMHMRLEESESRLEDPWLLLPEGCAPPSNAAELAGEWTSDFKEAAQDKAAFGASLWLGPSFLAEGNVRMLRRTAQLLRTRGPLPGQPALLPAASPEASGGGPQAALAIRERSYAAAKQSAMMAAYIINLPPQATQQAVAAGKAPKPGEGPTTEESKLTGFHDWAIAYDRLPSARSARAAACQIRARPGVGHGIGCGYVGSAYCILECALTVRAMGGVPAAHCGAGLSPCAALDFDEHCKARAHALRPYDL